jgi:ABC-type branched-subunit amino acid transport system substrate-binding protein
VAPLQEKTKFLMIADTIDNRVAKTSPFIFRPKLGEVTGAINLARIINPANKTFAVLSVNLDFAKDIISSFESEVDSLGGSIVIKEMYDKGKTDFRTELTKIKGKGVDGIFFIDYSGPGSINFYKQRSELGLNDIEVYGDTLTGYDTFLKMDPQNREMMEGVISMVWPTTQEIASENKKLEQFIEKYEPKYGSLVKGFDVQYSYSYILLLDSIIKKCSHNDVDCFKDEMFKYTLTSPYDSIVGPIYFDKDGNGEASVKFVKLINGKWIEIK